MWRIQPTSGERGEETVREKGVEEGERETNEIKKCTLYIAMLFED